MLKRCPFFLLLCFLISGIFLVPGYAFLDHGGMHWRVIGRAKVTPMMCPAPVRPPVNGGGGECSLGISRPSRTGTFQGLFYCAYDNEEYAHITQSWLGQGNVGTVHGVPNHFFRVHNKLWATSATYVAERWGINPNFLFGIALKESTAPENCVPPTGNTADGCFQITPGGGFAQIQASWPQYIGPGASHAAMVQNFPTEVVLAALYFVWEDDFWSTDSAYRNWPNLRENSADREAAARLLGFGYNQGAYGDFLTIINSCPLTETDVRACVARTRGAPTNPASLETQYDGYITQTSSYCRILSGSSNLYEAQLSWNDLQEFIDETLRPTYAGTLTPAWSAIEARAEEAFHCLEQGGTISFRYDFKTWLRQILPLLP